MEMTDLAMLKTAMNDNCQMSPYENFMVADKVSKKPSNVGIAALTIGSVGLVAGIGAWVFGGIYSNSRANANQRTLDAYASEHSHTMDALARLLAAERNERVAGDINITQNANPVVQNTALAAATNQIVADALSGRSAVCPQKVSLYSSPVPCPCVQPQQNCPCGM